MNSAAAAVRGTVFVSWPEFAPEGPATGARLAAAGLALRLAPKHGARAPEEVARLAGDCVAALVSTDPFPEPVLAACPALRIIARVGVGVDSIDVAAATARGIAVTVTPGMNAESVADQTLALILALARRVVAQDAQVRAGRWQRFGALLPWEIAGRTAGIVGAGTIGRAVARRLAAFGARLLFHDPAADLPGAARAPSLAALLAASDLVTLHLPLAPDTRGLIGAAEIAAMKPGAILVNTARGGIVDEPALFAALRSGHLGGAALDVFAVEPPDPAAFADVPNLLLSAHMGGLSAESVARMTASATDSILRVLAGECPPTVINPAALARARR